MPKRSVSIPAPRTPDAWGLPPTHTEPALRLWARANRLHNELNAAATREDALAAAVGFLVRCKAVSQRSMVAKHALLHLSAATTPAFSAVALQRAVVRLGGAL